MPHIRVRGMYEEDVRRVAPKFIEEMVKRIDCPRDHVTVEVLPTIWIEQAGSSQAYPFIEVHWFDRRQEIQDEIAAALTDAVMDEGFEEVAVLFYPLLKEKYYDNGVHY
jgi:hypothetical protein